MPDVLASPMATMPASEFRRWLDAEKARVRSEALEEAAKIAEDAGTPGYDAPAVWMARRIAERIRRRAGAAPGTAAPREEA